MNQVISKTIAKRLWLRAQGLDRPEPFGSGAGATPRAVEHLGYVQIDTINVIERCHHHILFSRIPGYRREHLHQSQTRDKTVFEYWTHALSYVPTKDFRYFMRDMKSMNIAPGKWFSGVKEAELRRVIRLIKKNGALSIRDIEDDVLVEKTHAWASRKPSKRALQLAFYRGLLTISERQGMLKKYELSERHFAWQTRPKAARQNEILDYLIDRSLRAQGLISLDSICHLDAKKKPEVLRRINARVRRKELIPVSVNEVPKIQYWMKPDTLEGGLPVESDLTHILSPFDPLIIQRKRLKAIFDYEHIFEAYVPKEKRIFGYFALPVLIGDRIVATVDLKTDRSKGKLLMQKWKWLPKGKAPENKRKIEAALDLFESFQLAKEIKES